MYRYIILFLLRCDCTPVQIIGLQLIQPTSSLLHSCISLHVMSCGVVEEKCKVWNSLLILCVQSGGSNVAVIMDGGAGFVEKDIECT